MRHESIDVVQLGGDGESPFDVVRGLHAHGISTGHAPCSEVEPGASLLSVPAKLYQPARPNLGDVLPR